MQVAEAQAGQAEAAQLAAWLQEQQGTDARASDEMAALVASQAAQIQEQGDEIASLHAQLVRYNSWQDGATGPKVLATAGCFERAQPCVIKGSAGAAQVECVQVETGTALTAAEGLALAQDTVVVTQAADVTKVGLHADMNCRMQCRWRPDPAHVTCLGIRCALA